MACTYLPPRRPSSPPTPMPIGVDVHIPNGQHPVIVYFLVTIWSLGSQNGSPLCLGIVRRLNIRASPMWCLTLVGYKIFFWSFIVIYELLPWFTVIILVQYICLGFLSNINALNISKWIFTLFVRRWLVAKFASYISHFVIRLHISLRTTFLWFFLKIFVPVSTFDDLPFRLRACVRLYVNLVMIVYLIWCILLFVIFGMTCIVIPKLWPRIMLEWYCIQTQVDKNDR